MFAAASAAARRAMARRREKSRGRRQFIFCLFARQDRNAALAHQQRAGNARYMPCVVMVMVPMFGRAAPSVLCTHSAETSRRQRNAFIRSESREQATLMTSSATQHTHAQRSRPRACQDACRCKCA